MKKTLVSLLLVMAIATLAAQKNTFLRIYNLSGKKIAKGYFSGTTDSTLMLISNNQVIVVPANQINIIRTRRSIGHTIGVTTAIVTGVACIGFLAGSGKSSSWLSYSAGDAIGAGLIVGTVSGVVIGGIAGAAKNSKKLSVNNNMENWMKVKAELDKMTVATVNTSD